MDKSIVLEILGLLEATPAVLVVAGIGFIFAGIVFAVLIALYRMLKGLGEKYQIINTNHMALWVMVAPEAVKWHHSGEYYIDMKALADIAAERNKQRKDV